MASKANFTLICQAVETVVGLSVIRLITYKKLEDQEDASDDPADALFNYSLQVSHLIHMSVVRSHR